MRGVSTDDIVAGTVSWLPCFLLSPHWLLHFIYTTLNALFIKSFGVTLRSQQMAQNSSSSMGEGKMEGIMQIQSSASITQHKQC